MTIILSPVIWGLGPRPVRLDCLSTITLGIRNSNCKKFRGGTSRIFVVDGERADDHACINDALTATTVSARQPTRNGKGEVLTVPISVYGQKPRLSIVSINALLKAKRDDGPHDGFALGGIPRIIEPIVGVSECNGELGYVKPVPKEGRQNSEKRKTAKPTGNSNCCQGLQNTE